MNSIEFSDTRRPTPEFAVVTGELSFHNMGVSFSPPIAD